MQTIELFIKDEDEDGVFAISLVENPAIMEFFGKSLTLTFGKGMPKILKMWAAVNKPFH